LQRVYSNTIAIDAIHHRLENDAFCVKWNIPLTSLIDPSGDGELMQKMIFRVVI